MNTVLVFSGLDPGGGAGLSADIAAIGAMGAHALPIATALTVQDNERVLELAPVDTGLIVRQAETLIARFAIDAVKLGIPGNRANAVAIAALVKRLRERAPRLPVVLDPVLASGRGDALGQQEALAALLDVATLLVPNLPEAAALGPVPCAHVLLTGGHGEGDVIVNRWLHDGGERAWRWPRLPGEFHGSGCTLAAAIAARLAQGDAIADALERAQAYCHAALAQSFALAPGQRIPRRFLIST
ncbi:bifunctional hydroxymethylpyrimidine kinase/phosphomethylpyrimidine kinase [Massilia sp. S19_KUP03_FR1]|uniref:bifunctional hydroxymethylpyrimidine kinase/phosphomethylpyrimidine kinase n=1 Tax=Massilia sp. S19_KUP03_FR1 TaxID=3025503 RepID=UPI002FCCD2B8